MAPDHDQHPTNLREQDRQDKPKHGEVFRCRSQQAMGTPCSEPNGCFGLGVCRLPDRRHRGVENLAPVCDSRFAFAAERCIA